ncbi:putative Flagellar assembly factor fliW [Candidatus Methylomirabilis oxygeniifera]|uniref:Flagellar assembly factor FliW n=1 Tax=Methylomirabilis oxygeniifera TaxID=671143 RepID=D5MGH8_METO1|nr:putative Flagellar assembly factor fliW [Candidatus Methylomirabilis oxyfera]
MDGALAEQTVFYFPQGLPGFEELARFFLCDREGLQPLTLLIALDTSDVAIPLLRCADFLTDYSPPIPATDLEALEARNMEELELFVVVTFEGNGGVAANLMAPICVNRTHRLGRQVVLSDGTYPLQYLLLPEHE